MLNAIGDMNRISGMQGRDLLEKNQFVCLCILLGLLILFAGSIVIAFIPSLTTLAGFLFAGSTILIIVVGTLCAILYLIGLIQS